MIGIDKKQLELNLLNRLEDPDEWESFLDRTKYEWSFDPDASCDDGIWCDDSRWRWSGEYLGYRVEVTALPGDRWARYEEEPPIGDVYKVRVIE